MEQGLQPSLKRQVLFDSLARSSAYDQAELPLSSLYEFMILTIDPYKVPITVTKVHAVELSPSQMVREVNVLIQMETWTGADS